MKRLALGCAALLLLSACDDGDGGDSSGSGSSGAASSTGEDPSTSGSPTTGTTSEPTTDDGTSSSTSGDEGDTSSGGPGDSSSSGGEGSSSTGEPIECDPPVVGEYNACYDDNGDPMPVLCNYMGSGKSVGQVSCLSGPMKGSNVCMIQNCVDDCDCFAAPQTGDAPSVCREVLSGGGLACILACDNGQTCPDGMTCDAGICWHGL